MTAVLSLDREWSFRRLADGAAEPEVRVDLPHSPFVADLDGREHWFGVCEYRRTIRVSASPEGGVRLLHVGAAMHTAIVLVDGRELARHEGGFLPFAVDLTAVLADGAAHELVLRLDNRDSLDVPPGKPYGELDFCWYGGLYRGVELRTYPSLHITDPIAADQVAGGGVFLRTLGAAPDRARVSARVQVCNAGTGLRRFRVQTVFRRGGIDVATELSPEHELAAAASAYAEQELVLGQPALWSPAAPQLHDVEVSLIAADGTVLDRQQQRFGVRCLAFSRSGGLTVNGERIRPRGTNRHQEFPRVGYAAPRAAQYRDARRIKEAGFDYIRLSHYPQSPDFMDACDELGLLVMNCIPGWQYCGGDKFQAACVANARQLIRRDRNHACVALWELSLNETQMSEAFMARLHAAGHEEFPGDQMFTCGWMDRFDVFIHSRQHGRIHSWQNGDKALVIAEYGDWEFYAANEGFDQTTGAGVLAASSNSRHLRGEGERALRRQATNFLVALDDTLASPAVCDGQWAMFDYARGYHTQRAACGVMDIFRLPKFAYHFYRSQRGPAEVGTNWTGGPVVFIASHWTEASDLSVLVYSNCDEVELTLNGRSLGVRKPELTWQVQHLPHPPFVFDLPRFTAGTLLAVGRIGGKPVAQHVVSTPGAVRQLAVTIDDCGIKAGENEPDVQLVHAKVLDAQGTLCAGAEPEVTFALEGDAEIVGPTTLRAEAGIASVVVRVPAGGKPWQITAAAEGLASA